MKIILHFYVSMKYDTAFLCKMYYNLWGVETVSFRYFNVYGDRQPLKGQYAPVIGLFLRQKKNNKPMTVVGDGLQTRDFTNVEDVVNANILACKTNNKDILGEIINIGSGIKTSVLELVNIFENVIGKKINKSYENVRNGDVASIYADNKKAETLLNWKALYECKHGCETFWNWKKKSNG